MNNTPVAFFIFNRPDTTQKVFEAIGKAKPKKLYVFADGPRKEKNELQNCLETRKVIDGVDWDCEVIKKFSETNLGCQSNISQGLAWLFEREENAIILEDDCLPNESFFPFCEELLKRYKDNKQIMTISGSNFQFGKKRSEHSYYFSRYNHCWGWATWKRSWKLYDSSMVNWPEQKDKLVKETFSKFIERQYWKLIFQQVYSSKISTWDYKFTYAIFQARGLNIIPIKNLVSNIGFDSGGTHTLDSNNKLANLKTESLEFPLNHPAEIFRSTEADNFSEEIAFSGNYFKLFKTWAASFLGKKIKYKLKRIIF